MLRALCNTKIRVLSFCELRVPVGRCIGLFRAKVNQYFLYRQSIIVKCFLKCKHSVSEKRASQFIQPFLIICNIRLTFLFYLFCIVFLVF